MPEDRAQQHHRERLIEALREEIGTMLEGELADPRIGLATVSEVVMAPGGKSVRVFVTVPGDEKEAAATLAGLNAAKGFMRRMLTARLGLRHCPDLLFQVDRSEQQGSRIDELLGRISKRSKSRPSSVETRSPEAKEEDSQKS